MKSNRSSTNYTLEDTSYDDNIIEITPESERFIINRLGYKIEVKNHEGDWLDRISIADDNGGTIHIKNLRNIRTNDQELNIVLQSIIKRTIEIYLPDTVDSYIHCLSVITSELNTKNIKPSDALKKFLTNAAIGKYKSIITPRLASSIVKQLVAYLVAHEYPRLRLEDAEEIAGVKTTGSQNLYSKIFLMDDSFGPFTREEMGIIQEALDNDNLKIPLDSRVMSLLCIEWGLRPIQISLLKESDFYYNPQNDIYWLNIPRVKQKQKNRRTQFKKRLISKRLGRLIQTMIESNKWIKSYYRIEELPLFNRRFEKFIEEKNGIMVVNDGSVLNPNRHLYSKSKDSFSFHIPTERVISRLHEVEHFLPLSPRTGTKFNLTAYRFRYTLGTASVTQGMRADEVAERLDHSGTDTVRHYFKNTEHLWEVIQEATTSRVEQGDFVAKFMSKEPQGKNIYAVDITERKTFTSIGQCHKGAVCSLEPAIACYSCSEFKPNDNVGSHKKAKEVIVEFRSRAQSQSSTGEIQHVFDEALVGVEAAIVYADKSQDVFSIVDGEPRHSYTDSLSTPIAMDTANE